MTRGKYPAAQNPQLQPHHLRDYQLRHAVPRARRHSGWGYRNISGFLDFLPCAAIATISRESESGSILQTLNLMSDSLIMNRTNPTGPAGSLLASNISLPQYSTCEICSSPSLSRYPTSQELSTALGNLSNSSTRQQEAQNLLWSLYNKVDFHFQLLI